MNYTGITLVLIGLLSMSCGIILILFPKRLIKMSDYANRVFDTDVHTLKYRLGIGVSLMIISIFLAFMSFYSYKTNMHLKGHHSSNIIVKVPAGSQISRTSDPS